MNRRNFVAAGISALTVLPQTSTTLVAESSAEWRHTSFLFGNAWDMLGTASEDAVEIVNVGLEDGFRVLGVIHNNSDDAVFVTGLISSDPEIQLFSAITTVQYVIPLGGYALVSSTLEPGLELDSVKDLPGLTVEWVTPTEAEAQFLHMYETVGLAVVDFAIANDWATYTLQNMYDADAANYVGMVLRFNDDGVVTNHSVLSDSQPIRANATREFSNFVLYEATPDDIFLVGFFGHVS